MVRAAFVPEAESPKREKSADGAVSPKRSFQPTLFNVKFGSQRNRLPPSKIPSPNGKRLQSPTEEKRPSKKLKADDEELQTTSVAPEHQHRGPFHQVSRAEFCDQYRIDGLPDADIFYQPDFISPAKAEEWRQQLDQLPEWYRPKLKVYGREITQSREIAAYATAPGLHLNYSGHPVEMHAPFPPLLSHIASLISTDACIGSEVRFNHCMLNRYDDGSVYIGKHSDNIENQVIVTVSLGADRSWIMERKIPRGQKEKLKDEPRLKKRWTLNNGSLLVMQGQTQKHYTHEIPKELKIKGPRISITFRQLVYDK